jgi:CRISPR-associated protein Csm5
LELEKQFFEKLSKPKKLSDLINNIDGLLKQLKDLTQDEFIMRISWGAGWKGMTGDFVNDLKYSENSKWIEIFRKKYQLGKKDFPIFPKTRRIVFDGDVPKYLTGWIKVKLNDTKPLNETDQISSHSNQTTSNNLDPLSQLKQKYKVVENKKKK